MSDLEAPLDRAGKVAFGAEILGTYARVRVRMRRRGLPATIDSLRPRPAGAVGEAAAARAARGVEAVLFPLPTDSRCLVTSLVLIAVLARRGAGGSLVIGVVPGPRFAAHAWVELDGRPLLKPGAASDGRLVELG